MADTMNVSNLSFLRLPLQYLQYFSSKVQQIWREKFGPFFQQLQETLAQKCSCFRWSISRNISNETSVKADELATKTLQPSTQPVTDKTILQLPLPLDPKTIVKTLDNGFTYYIRENAYPSKETATLRLVVRAGSSDEQEHERGLAHFLEHLLFYETENFDKQHIKRFLESKGSSFGADQNAHTTFNETVYKFNIPLNDPELLDKALCILREMATKAKITESSVEEERAVVLDEIRGESAGTRYGKKRNALLFEGTPYPHRHPNGLEKVIRECTPDQIKAFYKRNYQPQNMALVAVGDFDQKQVDALIQKHFGDMSPSTEAPIKHDFQPVKRTEPQYLCHADPESTESLLQIYYPLKTEFSAQEFTVENVRQGIINSLYQIMFNQRLEEIISDSDFPPFIFAQGNKAELMDNLFYYRLNLIPNEEIPTAYRRLLLELKRVQEHGFLPQELEAAKKRYKTLLEHLESEKNQISNIEFAKTYISHFLDGSPYLETEKIITLKQKLLESIKTEHINIWSKILTANKGTFTTAIVPDSLKDTISPEILQKISEETALETVAPYQHTAIERPLLRQIPKPGKIVDSTVLEKVGVTKLTLENGMEVYIRPSKQSENTILIYASAIGGELSMPDEKRAATDMGLRLYAQSGQAGLTPSQLQKVLLGKAVGQNITIGNYTTSLLTTSSKKDLDTAFQLLYNAYADRSLRKEAFDAIKRSNLNEVKHQDNDPEFTFRNIENALCTQNHVRFQPITAEEYEKAEFLDAAEFVNKELQNPGNYSLVITGNVDPETIKPFLEKYLAGLPGQKTKFDFASFNYPKYEYPAEVVVKEVEAGIDTSCQTHISFPAPAQDTKESRQLGNWTAGLLKMHLYDLLTFVKGENYAVDCEYALTTIPGQEKTDPSSMEVEISGLPENIRELNKIVLKEIERLQTEGFTQEEIDSYRTQVKETYRKAMDLDSVWTSIIASNARWGWNVNTTVEDFHRMLDEFDTKTAQEQMKKLFPLDRYVQVTLFPKPKAAEE